MFAQNIGINFSLARGLSLDGSSSGAHGVGQGSCRAPDQFPEITGGDQQLAAANAQIGIGQDLREAFRYPCARQEIGVLLCREVSVFDGLP